MLISKETKYNIVQGVESVSFSSTCVENPLNNAIRKRLPKKYKVRNVSSQIEAFCKLLDMHIG
jgi:hypothetical protein